MKDGETPRIERHTEHRLQVIAPTGGIAMPSIRRQLARIVMPARQIKASRWTPSRLKVTRPEQLAKTITNHRKDFQAIIRRHRQTGAQTGWQKMDLTLPNGVVDESPDESKAPAGDAFMQALFTQPFEAATAAFKKQAQAHKPAPAEPAAQLTPASPEPKWKRPEAGSRIFRKVEEIRQEPSTPGTVDRPPVITVKPEPAPARSEAEPATTHEKPSLTEIPIRRRAWKEEVPSARPVGAEPESSIPEVAPDETYESEQPAALSSAPAAPVALQRLPEEATGEETPLQASPDTATTAPETSENEPGTTETPPVLWSPAEPAIESPTSKSPTAVDSPRVDIPGSSTPGSLPVVSPQPPLARRGTPATLARKIAQTPAEKSENASESLGHQDEITAPTPGQEKFLPGNDITGLDGNTPHAIRAKLSDITTITPGESEIAPLSMDAPSENKGPVQTHLLTRRLEEEPVQPRVLQTKPEGAPDTAAFRDGVGPETPGSPRTTSSDILQQTESTVKESPAPGPFQQQGSIPLAPEGEQNLGGRPSTRAAEMPLVSRKHIRENQQPALQGKREEPDRSPASPEKDWSQGQVIAAPVPSLHPEAMQAKVERKIQTDSEIKLPPAPDLAEATPPDTVLKTPPASLQTRPEPAGSDPVGKAGLGQPASSGEMATEATSNAAIPQQTDEGLSHEEPAQETKPESAEPPQPYLAMRSGEGLSVDEPGQSPQPEGHIPSLKMVVAARANVIQTRREKGQKAQPEPASTTKDAPASPLPDQVRPKPVLPENYTAAIKNLETTLATPEEAVVEAGKIEMIPPMPSAIQGQVQGKTEGSEKLEVVRKSREAYHEEAAPTPPTSEVLGFSEPVDHTETHPGHGLTPFEKAGDTPSSIRREAETPAQAGAPQDLPPAGEPVSLDMPLVQAKPSEGPPTTATPADQPDGLPSEPSRPIMATRSELGLKASGPATAIFAHAATSLPNELIRAQLEPPAAPPGKEAGTSEDALRADVRGNEKNPDYYRTRRRTIPGHPETGAGSGQPTLVLRKFSPVIAARRETHVEMPGIQDQPRVATGAHEPTVPEGSLPTPESLDGSSSETAAPAHPGTVNTPPREGSVTLRPALNRGSLVSRVANPALTPTRESELPQIARKSTPVEGNPPPSGASPTQNVPPISLTELNKPIKQTGARGEPGSAERSSAQSAALQSIIFKKLAAETGRNAQEQAPSGYLGSPVGTDQADQPVFRRAAQLIPPEQPTETAPKVSASPSAEAPGDLQREVTTAVAPVFAGLPVVYTNAQYSTQSAQTTGQLQRETDENSPVSVMSAAGEGPGSGIASAPEVDLRALARQVYPILKRMLAAEKERYLGR